MVGSWGRAWRCGVRPRGSGCGWHDGRDGPVGLAGLRPASHTSIVQRGVALMCWCSVRESGRSTSELLKAWLPAPRRHGTQTSARIHKPVHAVS